VRVRSVGVVGVCRLEGGTLLVPDTDGRWSLPGGEVHHGEHPRDAMLRIAYERTGRRFQITKLLDAVTDLEYMPGGVDVRHFDRIVYRIAPVNPDGELRGFVCPDARLGDWALTAASARVLGLGGPATDIDLPPDEPPAGLIRRRQRFAAYGLVTDPDGKVLLTQISAGYPGAGRWHLPGGGTDFGETPTAGLEREIAEETGQKGTIGELLIVSHRHQTDAFGPEGVPIDWHGVRVVFRVRVEDPTPARVLDGGGSTVEAGWFGRDEALRLPLTEVALEMITDHL
jgi:8-oxo-dGTP diphosphatase